MTNTPSSKRPVVSRGSGFFSNLSKGDGGSRNRIIQKLKNWLPKATNCRDNRCAGGAQFRRHQSAPPRPVREPRWRRRERQKNYAIWFHFSSKSRRIGALITCVFYVNFTAIIHTTGELLYATFFWFGPQHATTASSHQYCGHVRVAQGASVIIVNRANKSPCSLGLLCGCRFMYVLRDKGKTHPQRKPATARKAVKNHDTKIKERAIGVVAGPISLLFRQPETGNYNGHHFPALQTGKFTPAPFSHTYQQTPKQTNKKNGKLLCDRQTIPNGRLCTSSPFR